MEGGSRCLYRGQVWVCGIFNGPLWMSYSKPAPLPDPTQVLGHFSNGKKLLLSFQEKHPVCTSELSYLFKCRLLEWHLYAEKTVEIPLMQGRNVENYVNVNLNKVQMCHNALLGVITAS